MALVEIERLTYAYGGAEGMPRLRECSLSVDAGEMVLLVGPSGCGKSTLLRAVNGLVPHFWGGTMSGRVRVAGLDTREVKPAELAHLVACVFQDPEAQIVASSVFEEVAFGLESLGVEPAGIPLRIHEALGAMGIAHLAERPTGELSGGEMQRVELAAALALRPSLLLLDEPTSQLDPSAAESLLELLRRVNEDFGIAVIIAEHRLERCYHWADRVVVMYDGAVVSDAPPRESAAFSLRAGDSFVPPVTRLFAGLPMTQLPLTVKEGRAELQRLVQAGGQRDAVAGGERRPAAPHGRASDDRAARPLAAPRPSAIAVRDLRFTYPDGFEALRGCSLEIARGEFVAVMGENGAGKSTLVRHFNGLSRASAGAVFLLGRDVAGTPVEELAKTCAVLGQNPNDLLFCDTVAEELAFSLKHLRPELGAAARESAIARALSALGIAELALCEPRSLSAGQRQRVAIAAMAVADPAVLVLDEPTRGLDWDSKCGLGRSLRTFQGAGTTVVVVTHDVEFAAAFSDRTVVMGAGRILADGPTPQVLGSATFLAPQVSRVLAALGPGYVTVEAGRAALQGVVSGG